jgi:hypothetical protein
LLRRLEDELGGVSPHGPGTKEKREVLKRVIAYLGARVKLMEAIPGNYSRKNS